MRMEKKASTVQIEKFVPRPILKAETRVCVCKGENAHQAHVKLISFPGVGTEFESLDQYYCRVCNSNWMEP